MLVRSWIGYLCWRREGFDGVGRGGKGARAWNSSSCLDLLFFFISLEPKPGVELYKGLKYEPSSEPLHIAFDHS